MLGFLLPFVNPAGVPLMEILVLSGLALFLTGGFTLGMTAVNRADEPDLMTKSGIAILIGGGFTYILSGQILNPVFALVAMTVALLLFTIGIFFLSTGIIRRRQQRKSRTIHTERAQKKKPR